MNTSEQLHSRVRLLVAGFTSLLLLIWTLMAPGLPPLIVPPGLSVSPWPLLLTSFLAAMILVILGPVVFHGSGGERWVSVALGVFPLLVLSVVVVWTASLLRRGGF